MPEAGLCWPALMNLTHAHALSSHVLGTQRRQQKNNDGTLENLMVHVSYVCRSLQLNTQVLAFRAVDIGPVIIA
jgi:hypothetical protein